MEDRGQVIIYKNEDSQTQLNVKMHNETVWLA